MSQVSRYSLRVTNTSNRGQPTSNKGLFLATRFNVPRKERKDRYLTLIRRYTYLDGILNRNLTVLCTNRPLFTIRSEQSVQSMNAVSNGREPLQILNLVNFVHNNKIILNVYKVNKVNQVIFFKELSKIEGVTTTRVLLTNSITSCTKGDSLEVSVDDKSNVSGVIRFHSSFQNSMIVRNSSTIGTNKENVFINFNRTHIRCLYNKSFLKHIMNRKLPVVLNKITIRYA